MDNSTKTTHPLILIAATAVTVASLAAVAYFTGLLPGRSSEAPAAPLAEAGTPTQQALPPAPAAPAPQADKAPATPEPAKAAAKPRAPGQATNQATNQAQAGEPARPLRRSDGDWRYESGQRRVSSNEAGIDVIASRPAAAGTPAPTPPSRAICHDCGTVESVREITAKDEGSGLGAIAGGVLGGVLGNQVGRGTGKDLATIAGAVGGAVAGHEVEKNVRGGKQYEVTVRFDDGALRTYTLASPDWRSGDRVRLAGNGTLIAAAAGER